MSLFSERISWNEIKKIVESFTGRTVVGDGEAKLLHYPDLTAIQIANHQYVYFGDIHINADPFGDEYLIQYENEQGTATDTYKRGATGLETPASITNDIIFNKVAAIPATADGQIHILAYKIELKTDLGTVYNYSNATLPVTGWSKVGTTYTHAAGTANTLSFPLSLPAGNYIMYATANISADIVTFGTDELGGLIALSGTGSQSGSYEFYSTGIGSVLTVVPDSTFVGSFTEADIYIQQVIYS